MPGRVDASVIGRTISGHAKIQGSCIMIGSHTTSPQSATLQTANRRPESRGTTRYRQKDGTLSYVTISSTLERNTCVSACMRPTLHPDPLNSNRSQ